MGKANRTGAAYARAGVDIDAKMNALKAVKSMIRGTFTGGVAGDIGHFGGLFRAPGLDRLLVSSTDGVGTKLKVACLAGRHDTVGEDLVNHCVNDILVQGAEPLFFLDYVGMSRMNPRIFRQVVAGLCRACRRNGCALIGGETAELPNLYPDGEYDLVGTIVGSVPRRELVTGAGIRPGDVLIGLPSSGLHTNGYSLARRVILEEAGLKLRDRLPGTRRTVAQALLAVHRSYLQPVRALKRVVPIRGMAHITGGGFPDNIARILPPDVCAVVDRALWPPPPLFRFIQEAGRVDRDEMYRVFNMGIGLVIFVREGRAVEAVEVLRAAGERAVAIGQVDKGRGEVVLTN